MSEAGCAQSAEVVQMEKELQDLFEKWRGTKGSLIPVLQGAQEIYGYLPKEVLLNIARELKLPPSRVFGVVTFYAPAGHTFAQRPQPIHFSSSTLYTSKAEQA
jgi:NADH-quinone oxidoreductase subunit E